MKQAVLDLSRSESKHRIVGYVTDIEGNYDYWQRYVAISKVLQRLPDGSLELCDDSELVFGGDVCDRGSGDIRVVRDLLQLRRKYADRVHIILGNRDVNKLRIDIELHSRNLTCPGQVYWIDQTSEPNQTSADRLKWILLRTMGAPGAFEYRRQELAEMNMGTTDADVVRSYVNWLSPKGEMIEFLSYGKVAVIIGDTLFLHGALKPSSVGWVPPRRGEKSGGYCVDKIRDWVNHINSFVTAEVKDYQDNIIPYMQACLKFSSNDGIPFWAQEGGYNHSMPGSRLLQYGMGWMPDKSINPTAIYACYLNSASPTFTAKLVTKLTETAVQENQKRKSQLKITFQRASRAAASLKRLQLAVHHNSIVHEPKTSRSEEAHSNSRFPEDDGEDFGKGVRKSHIASMSAKSDSGVSSSKKFESPSPKPVPPPLLTSPVDRAEAEIPLEYDMSTSSTIQSCVNSVVSYFSMFVDGAVYAFYKEDPPVEPTAQPSIPPSGPTTPQRSKSVDSAFLSKSLPMVTQSELDIQRQKDAELIKIVPSVTPVGGLFANVKEIPAEEREKLSNQPSKDRLGASSTSSSMTTSAFGTNGLENESAEVQLNHYLLTSGIRNIVVGHQPRGDAPLILETDDGLKIISADTSYAINTQWTATFRAPQIADDSNIPLVDTLPPPPADSTRGVAVCEVYLDITYDASAPAATSTNLYLQGRLSNGLPYEFELGAADPEYVGRKTPSGWYVKASGIIAMEAVKDDQINEPKSYYLLTQLEGFIVRNKLVLEDDIEKEFEETEEQKDV